MSSDDNKTPHSGKRKKFVKSESEDSDGSIVQSYRRKKTFKFVSDGESSDEDSDIQTSTVWKQKRKVVIEDDSSLDSSTSGKSRCEQFGESSDSSEWQSDWSSSSEIDTRSPMKRKHVSKSPKKTPKIVSDTDTDSNDEQLEKCPICLLPFKRQQLATPAACEHCFCLECLIEWSKNTNTCPVDRQLFTIIHVRDKVGGQVVNSVPVQVAPREEESLDDLTFCEVCHQSDREDRMLLCDGCDCGYHLECLTPPLTEVPLDQWFCPECSLNSQGDAEVVEIDMDEISDLMEEARRLGVSYGRTRANLPTDAYPRVIPRTRHTERVRATIRRRSRMNSDPSLTHQLTIDPNQPSTSSGLESYGDNSRSRSPSNASNSLGNGEQNCSSRNLRKRSRKHGSSSSESSDESVSREYVRNVGRKSNSSGSQRNKTRKKRGGTKKGKGSSSRKKDGGSKSKKSGRSRKVSGKGTILKKVTITECNENGEEEEIVTYVKVTANSSRRKRRRRRKRRHRARTVSSVLATTKKRLASAIGICKPDKGIPALIPSVRNRTIISDRSLNTIVRRNAGIPRLSLLGDGLNLDYSPPGSDTEDYRSSIGPGVAIQRHSVISARRRVRLKNISAPQQPRTDLLSSIINDQEVWHSKSSSVTLKANGTLLIEKKENVGKSDEPTEKLSSTPGEIESVGDDRVSTVDVPMEVSRINPESITQAPMYNNPCGGGNRGNFRGGYRDNTRHSHGGQNYARDSLSGSGRHRYSGNSGNFGRDFGPPGFYNPNFDHCGPPMFGGNPPFRNRNPQHFRNDRFRFTPSGRPQFNFGENVNEHHPHREQFNPSRSPHVHFDCPQNNMPPNLPEDTLRVDAVEQQPQDGEGTSVRQEEDCDIYCDIETKSDGELQDQQNGSMTLLPPPEPPSGLLDFEENSRSDKDSDQELVIDDSRKEDAPRNDKYDPFSVDSDSDSDTRKNEESSEKKREELPGKITVQAETSNTSVPLLVYDDEDEEDSRSDCPNFSIYSSTTIDVARRTEQQLSQQIGPLEPPPLPPSIPDDDDVIVGDVQACDLTDIPEPSDPYVEALRKERRTLSKIPSKKISHDSRGKITFKIGTKLKINNRLLGLQEEEDDEDSENEKKKEFECVKEEDVPVDREEERKRIARSKFEEMEEKENHMDEQEEVSVVTCEDLLNVEEKDIKDDKKDEECIEICKDKITMQKNIDTAASLPVTEQASSVTLENELTDECLAENESETSESFRKTSTIHISQGDSKDMKEIEESDKELRYKYSVDLGNNERDKEQSELTVDVEKEDDKDDEQMEEEEEEEEEEDDDEEEEEETFPIEKEKLDEKIISDKDLDKIAWESDGAYTPCKDERPLKESSSPSGHLPPIESGLEPITPTKDKPDDLDGCRTPVDYNVLGTEAISETDEAMNFEDELNVVTSRKEKEMEDGEIVDEKCTKDGEKIDKEKEDEKKRKKKEKKEKSNKETEKNKENIASENQVAWKKLSKSTKERSYRDKEKRSKSKEKEKEKPKKKKETVKKKEKRKELPRYDVRKVVAERPSRPRKDEYGRDIREKSRQRSRSRSLSSSKRSRSYSKLRSRSRSRTRLQRSWSRDRRSYSKSPSRRRSLSRGRRKSPKRRSASRKRSVSRRSLSRRRRSLSRRRSKRSMSRSRRSLSRSRQRRSRSRSRRSLSRSRDRRKDKKKYKSRSRSRNRKKSRSKSPRRSSKSRERKHSKRKVQSRSRSKGRSCSRNWDQVEKTVEHDFSREREERESWSAQWTPSWSRSISKTPQHVQQEQIAPREWSPMLDNVSFPPKNLTVILTNKEAIKKKKKERRKENKKAKDEKKRKGKRNRTPPPSKEIFTSGDNILVSVCFKKDNENDQAGVPELAESLPLVPPLKRRRRESLQVDPPKRSKKEKSKDKRSKSPKPKKDKKKKSKAAEIAATKKPVAVIDLDQSPFREQTPSPRDVIVLSDDDDKQIQQIATDQCQPPENSPPREQFVSQGPKTPPEPQIKFSINKQTSNLRPSMLNPLLDEEEEEEEEEMDERVEEELEMRAQEELELRLKIGPNTPPEPPTSPPTSPDAYDPFDPTKSRSPTPDVSQEANSNDERRRSPRKHESGDGNLLEEENMQTQERQSQEKQLLDKPKIISMVTIKRASPQREDVNENDSNKDSTISTGNLEVQQNQQNVQNQNNPFAAMNPVLATVAAAVQRSGVFNTPNSNSNQRNMLPSNRISPSNQQKQRSADRSQAPAVFTNSGKPSRGSKSGQTKSNGQNGNDPGGDTGDNVDMSSPYSPGSTLSDGIFDPPSPTNFNNSPPPGPTTGPGPVAPPTAKTSNSKTVKSSEKKDAFDNLFSTLPASKTASKSTRSKKPEKDKKRKSTNPKVGVRMDENQLQILDDLPSSAVEMQVKDKFLKKLNRQERVVEEVKLVLKPHYTKKHVTKEEYKDIMRKAVPKICHNKTGEINPKKIAHLIEAYVKKCRTSKKKTTESSSVKASKPVKSLWS